MVLRYPVFECMWPIEYPALPHFKNKVEQDHTTKNRLKQELNNWLSLMVF